MAETETKENLLLYLVAVIALLALSITALYQNVSQSKEIDALSDAVRKNIEAYPPFDSMNWAEKAQCETTCNAVATEKVCDIHNQTDFCYNYTEPHYADYYPSSGYCACLFQGKSRVFVFNAGLMLEQEQERLNGTEAANE